MVGKRLLEREGRAAGSGARPSRHWLGRLGTARSPRGAPGGAGCVLWFTYTVVRALRTGRARIAWKCYSLVKAQKHKSGAGGKAPSIHTPSLPFQCTHLQPSGGLSFRL